MSVLHLVGPALGTLKAYTTKADPLPVKLDANESPWALPDAVRAELASKVAALPLHRYPDLGARALKRALATRLDASVDELVLGVGSDEIIGILLAALDRTPEGRAQPAVLYPTPSFVMYPITAKVQGFEPIEVPLDDAWQLDVDAMRTALDTHRPNLVFFATPNNPTGARFDEGAMRALIAHAPSTLFVIDEAYAPFAGATLGGWVHAHDNVAVMGTLSKIGLAGLRVGWVRMRAELAVEVEKARPPYNLCSPSQTLAEQLLTAHAAELDAQVARIVSERGRLVAELDARDGLTPYPTEANFVLVGVHDAARVDAGLRQQGVQVRRFSDPRLAGALRVTVGTPEENDRLLAALDAL